LVSRSSIVPVTTYGPFGLASMVTSPLNNPLVRSTSRLSHPAGAPRALQTDMALRVVASPRRGLKLPAL
jgi:hypothetical protein